MINYTEKGASMHEYIRAQGYKLSQVDGVWQSSDDVAVQAIIDAYDPATDPIKWQHDMDALDTQITPRMTEDLYDAVVLALGSDAALPQALKDLMGQRKTHRAAKP